MVHKPTARRAPQSNSAFFFFFFLFLFCFSLFPLSFLCVLSQLGYKILGIKSYHLETLYRISIIPAIIFSFFSSFDESHVFILCFSFPTSKSTSGEARHEETTSLTYPSTASCHDTLPNSASLSSMIKVSWLRHMHNLNPSLPSS
jgi:hypothetical protein